MSNTLVVELETRQPEPTSPRQEPAARVEMPAGNGMTQPASSCSSPVLGRLLHMADTYRAGGGLRQAIEMYFEIVEKHSDTSEAKRAEVTLMEIATEYECAGELRQARAIYERLLSDQ